MPDSTAPAPKKTPPRPGVTPPRPAAAAARASTGSTPAQAPKSVAPVAVAPLAPRVAEPAVAKAPTEPEPITDIEVIGPADVPAAPPAPAVTPPPASAITPVPPPPPAFVAPVQVVSVPSSTVTPVPPPPAFVASAPPPPPASVAPAPQSPAPVAAAVVEPRPEPRRSMLFSTFDAFRPPLDPTAIAKMTPAVMARRAEFTRYVKGVVGGCAALCLVALVRLAVASEPDTTGVSSTAVVRARSTKSLEMAVEELKGSRAIYAFKGTPNRHR